MDKRLEAFSSALKERPVENYKDLGRQLRNLIVDFPEEANDVIKRSLEDLGDLERGWIILRIHQEATRVIHEELLSILDRTRSPPARARFWFKAFGP